MQILGSPAAIHGACNMTDKLPRARRTHAWRCGSDVAGVDQDSMHHMASISAAAP